MPRLRSRDFAIGLFVDVRRPGSTRQLVRFLRKRRSWLLRSHRKEGSPVGGGVQIRRCLYEGFVHGRLAQCL
jgi:hypothetical protein